MSGRKSNCLAVIFGCSGLTLTAEEEEFFRANPPVGFILFARNIQSPTQVRTLIASLKKATSNPAALILIDQEGGRVARLKPPHWRTAPATAVFRRLAAHDEESALRAAYINYRLIGEELYSLGITVNCAPMLDLLLPDAHDIVGDRSFGSEPDAVTIMSKAACAGLLDSGVLPVIKHIPGHGRARVDSHEALPEVATPLAELLRTDFSPFQALADMPLAMTAHIIYTAIDPVRPATLSPEVIRIIREDIGFYGLLLTDDLSMQALEGDLGALAEKSLKAGCDLVLHCNGKMEEMVAIAAATPALSNEPAKRLAAARKKPSRASSAFNIARAEEELWSLLG